MFSIIFHRKRIFVWMADSETVLLIDAGNTHVKICTVHNGVIQTLKRIPNTEGAIHSSLLPYGSIPKALSSVLDQASTEELEGQLSNCLLITTKTPLPITLDYETPETLGIDRICNACAMLRLSQTHVAISIDIGTCIKFDVLEGNTYKGGSISPGIDLRYRSMHEFTGRLPLLDNRNKIQLTGKSSVKSMHSGVINGIQAEINGLMANYRECYSDLTFFITGGDAVYFDFEGKSDIFVAENLTLEGMYTIYSFNAK